MTTYQQVVTWQSPRGATLDLCGDCERLLAGDWPKDGHGEDYCTVSHGAHVGDCDECTTTDDRITALGLEAARAGDERMRRMALAALGDESWCEALDVTEAGARTACVEAILAGRVSA